MVHDMKVSWPRLNFSRQPRLGLESNDENWPPMHADEPLMAGTPAPSMMRKALRDFS
jgi:hypothetical protein